jgi:hypothetical protein
MKNVSDKSCREIRNTHFMFKNVFENCAVYNAEKFRRAGQAKDNNTAHVLCMLDT